MQLVMRDIRNIIYKIEESIAQTHSSQQWYFGLSWLVFFINPLLSLPLILIGIWNGKTYSIYQLILFFALLAYLYPPSGDLYRYYELYYKNFKGIGYLDIFDFYIFDFGWYSVLYLIANLNLPFQFSQSVSCVIQLSITYYIINNLTSPYISKKERFLLIISSFIFTGFWNTIESRFAVGLSLFALGVFFINEKKYCKSAMLCIIACIIHFSFIFMSILLLLTCIFQQYINIKSCFLGGILIFLFIKGVGLYMEKLGFEKSVYLTNEGNWYDNASPLLQFFYKWGRSIPLIILSIYTIIRKENNFYKKISLIFITFVLTTFDFGDLNSRFKGISSTITWIYFIYTIKARDYNWILLFTLSAILSFMVNSSTANKAISLAKYEDLVFPIPYIICVDQYNDYWINTHINDGSVYIIS